MIPSVIYDRSRFVLLNELKRLCGNSGIVANVTTFGQPASQSRDLNTFAEHDADGEPCGLDIIRAVERHGRHRVAAEALLGFLAQAPV
jgi:hypothetical protein